ncbi:MAG TPA: hypothetical protein VFA47_06635 [Candidatus Manganitrophaceae bacterium]|nr:hypothetical protein [Candidatus Manganitrophaceae bacterium]
MTADRAFLRIFVFFLFLAAFPSSGFAAESLTFYDWEVRFQPNGNRPVSCSIHLTGVNRKQRVLLDVNLSVIIEKAPLIGRRATTILRVKANRINRPDLSDLSPIQIQNAWMATSLGSSLGQMAKIDVRPDVHYLGGKEGSGLFHLLLEGIVKDGAAIGYQEEAGGAEIVSSVPLPPPDVIINKLMPCLAAVLPDQDQPA